MIIEIEGLPEGWEAVAYRIGNKGDYAWLPKWNGVHKLHISLRSTYCFIVQKTKQRRIVLEETEETTIPDDGDYYEQDGRIVMSLGLCPVAKKIWRIKE